jgi:hypothetical protein
MMGHKELREKMASLLEEIPDIINECEKYNEIYPGNNSLRVCINEIHIHLLMALEDIIRWYGLSSASKTALQNKDMKQRHFLTYFSRTRA